MGAEDSRSSPPRTIRLDEPAASDFQGNVAKAIRLTLHPVLVVIAGPDVGKKTRVDGTLTIGRDPESGLVLSDPIISWRHARIEDRGDAWGLVDQNSTNGTLVNGTRVMSQLLAANDKVEMGRTTLRFEMQDAKERAYDEMLQKLIDIDDLSGLYQRRRFDQELAGLLAASAAASSTVGMLAMDLDGIKKINDAHGHLFGAHVIGEAGRVIGRVLGGRGFAARFGGDEYIAALSGADRAAAAAIAEEIRLAVNAHPYERGGIRLFPGISIGVAVFPEDASDASTLFQRADEALYRAKAAGKNCVRT